MLTLIYSPMTGMPYRDGEAKDYADAIVRLVNEGNDIIIEFSTDNILHQIRLAVKEGRINTDHIPVLLFFRKLIDGIIDPVDQQLMLYHNGRIDPWPKGFCDTNSDVLARLL